MKNPTVKSLQRKADKLWGQIILRRAGHKCEVCGEKASDPHHILRKERNAHLRFAIAPSNGIALCKRCHWQTRTDPMVVDAMILAFRGFEEVEALLSHERTSPWSIKSLGHVIVALEHGLALEDGAQ